MSVTSIAVEQQTVRTVQVEFFADEGEVHPTQLIFALAGVGMALDRLEPNHESREDFELIGNLSVAARVLATQLAQRLA